MRWCLLVLLLAVAGCTGNAEKGINMHKDMPVSPEKQDKPEKK